MKVSERFFLGEKFEHLADELDGLSDRAVAIVAAAIIDDALAGALRSKLIDDENLFKKQISGTGSLSSFSAKIDLGRLVGLYTVGAWADLHLIRKIRNDAAHSSGLFSLSDAPAADRARALVLAEHHILEVGAECDPKSAAMFVYGRQEVLANTRLRFVGTALFLAWQLTLGDKFGRYGRLSEFPSFT